MKVDEDGMSSPSITTAFWGDNNTITSIDNFVRLVHNGVYLLERQFMDLESAIETWRDYYEMTSLQIDLLRSIYDRKVNNPNVKFMLTKREIEIIGAESLEGLNESMTSFEEIGIYWEK